MAEKVMKFLINAEDRASTKFAQVGVAADALARKLDDLGKKRPNPKITVDSTAAKSRVDELAQALRELRNQRLRVDVEMGSSRADVGDLRRELSYLRDTRVKVEVRTGTARADLTAIAGRLAALSDTAVNVDVQTGDADGRITGLIGKLHDLKALSPVTVRVEVDDQATAGMSAVETLAAALAGASPTVRVDADTAAATAQLAAVAAQVAALASASPTIRLNLNAPTFLGQLSRIQRELRSIAGGSIEIDADTRAAMEELARLRVRLSELQAMAPSVVVDADTALARHQIEQLERRLARIAGEQYTARVDVDKGALARVAQFGTALSKIGLAGGLAAAGAASAASAVSALAAVTASAAGAAGLLPGALLAAQAAIGTVRLGIMGLDEAFKNLENPTKFAEALQELSPAGREFATTVRDLKPAFDGLRLDVQQHLLAGLGGELKGLAGAVLPAVKTGMVGVADSLNRAGKDLIAFAKEGRNVRDIEGIFGDTAKAIDAARPAALNLVSAFKDIAAVGTGMLPELAGGLSNVTGRFAEFVNEARQTGQLEGWIRGGLDTLRQLGSVAGNVGSILGSVFQASRAAGADFLSTLDRLTEGVAEFMRSGQGQSAMVAFFRESRAAIDALLPGLQTLGVAVAKAIQAFAESGGLRDFGRTFSELADRVAPLVERLGALSGGTLSGLAAGARAAGAAFQPIISGISGLLDVLGPVAPAITAMVIAFKGIAPLAALVTTLGARVTALAGSLGVASGAAAATGTALTRLAGALPTIAAGFVAVGIQAQVLQSGVDKGVAALLAGGKAARDFTESNDSLGERLLHNTLAFVTFGAAADAVSFKETTQEAKDLYEAMSPLEKAQTKATQALNNYNLAVEEHTAASPQARAAAAELAAATDRVAVAQRDAERATPSASDQIRDQVNAVQSALGAHLQLEDALKRVADAERAANDAAREHGAASEEATVASREFVSAADQAAQAAQSVAEAQAAAAGAADPAAAGTAAYGATLLQLAANASGPARSALMGYLSLLSQSQLDALSAGAAASGFATQVLTLPNGKTVTIAVDPETGKIITTQQLLDSMSTSKTIVIDGDTVPIDTALQRVLSAISLGQATVTINGQPMPAMEALQTVLSQADLAQATVTINGQSLPAQSVLDAYIGAVNSGSGTVTVNGQAVPAASVLAALLSGIDNSVGTATIDANPTPANTKHSATVSTINSSVGTLTIDGNPTAANGKTTTAVRFADGSRGTITVDGNPDPATGKVQGTVRYANGSTGTITLNARDLVSPVISRLTINTSSTHTVYVKTVGNTSTLYTAGGRTAATGAIGGIVQRMHDGGVVGYARGAVRLTPMRGGIAQRVPPNTMRVIGDRVDVDEFYLPDNNARRSMAIGAEWARRRGLALVPSAPGRTLSATPRASRMASPVVSRMAGQMTARPVASAPALALDNAGVISAVRDLTAVTRAMAYQPYEVSAPIVAAVRDLERVLVLRASAAVSAQVRRTETELGGLR